MRNKHTVKDKLRNILEKSCKFDQMRKKNGESQDSCASSYKLSEFYKLSQSRRAM